MIFYVVFFSYKILFRPNIKNIAFYHEDLFLAAFLIIALISVLINPFTDRTFSNLLAYFFTVFAYFLGLKMAIQDLKITSMQLGKAIYYSAVLCCIIMVVDFLLANFLNFQLRPLFVNLENGTANMTYYQKWGVLTVGGVAEEPGSMALILNIYGLIGIYYAAEHLSKSKFNLLFLLYICALATSGSIGAIMFVALSFLILKFRQAFSFKFLLYTILALGFIAILGEVLIQGFLNEFQQKLVLSDDSASAVIRLLSWKKGFETWMQNPILGMGPGYGKVINGGEGYLSFFLTVLADLGLFAFITIILFLFKILTKAIKTDKSKILALSLLTTIFHLWILGDFYHAPFWILLVFIQLVSIEKIKISKVKIISIEHP